MSLQWNGKRFVGECESVLILGAGASKGAAVAASPPVVRDFLARGLERVSHDYAVLWGFLETMGLSRTQLLQGDPDIEQALALAADLVSGLWYRSDDEYLEAVGPDFWKVNPVDLVVSFMIEVLDAPSLAALARPCPLHSQLFSSMKAACVIDFNYDLIADSALAAETEWSEACGYGFLASSIGNDTYGATESCSSVLLKPHGSLNWRRVRTRRWPEGGEPFGFLPRTAELPRGGPTSNRVRGVDPAWRTSIAVRKLEATAEHAYEGKLAIEALADLSAMRENLTDEGIAFLGGADGPGAWNGTYVIPPSAVKFGAGELPDEAVATWRLMLNALSTCGHLTVIGYSFLAEDREFHALLRLALRRNQNRPTIQVVDPDPAVLHRVELAAPGCRVGRAAASLEDYVRRVLPKRPL